MTSDGGAGFDNDAAEALVDYWFGTLTRKDWFARSDAVDEALRSRFAKFYEDVAANPPRADALTPRLALAAVLALDQLPRNLFRGTPRAFASDAAARGLAHDIVNLGYDRTLGADERAFLYLPFEHSEDLADQERSVALISALGDAEYTRFALAHRDIIERFGRFPHRNAVVGRPSTPEEMAFLQEPGSSF